MQDNNMGDGNMGDGNMGDGNVGEQDTQDSGPTVVVRVADYFYQDHVSRDLPAGLLLSVRNNVATVRVTVDEFAELLSDAEFYSSCAEHFDDRALTASAGRVLRALRKVQQTTDLPWVTGPNIGA
jgi:hypothetical protein